MTQYLIYLPALLILVAFICGIWSMVRSTIEKSHNKHRNNYSSKLIDEQKTQKVQEQSNLKAYDIQDFGGDKLALIFATDMLDAIKKFTDAFSNARKTKYEAHYTFFGEDHALLRMVDLSDFQDGGYLITPLTIFESNKIEYRSWRPAYKD